MIEPEKIPPGCHVSINSRVSHQSHQRLRHLRRAIAFKQGTEYRMVEIFQLAIEKGLASLEQELDVEPVEV